MTPTSRGKVRASSLDTSVSPTATNNSSDIITQFAINILPVYLSKSAAAELVANKQAERYVHTDESYNTTDITVTDRALSLINAFLDHLLLQILATGKAPTIVALRPAVDQILKGRLARQAFVNADEELRDLLEEGGEEEELAAIDEQTHNKGIVPWDVENTWKCTRLRIMVYSRFGEMNEEDEERLIREQFSADDPIEKRYLHSSALVTWTAAIFLTAVVEFVAEQCVALALEATQERLSHQSATNGHEQTSFVAVQDTDVERIARSTTMGRLWRTWKQGLRRASRSPTRATLSAQSLRRQMSNASSNAVPVMSGRNSLDEHRNARQLSSAGSEISRDMSPIRGSRGSAPFIRLGYDSIEEEYTRAGSSMSERRDYSRQEHPESMVGHEISHHDFGGYHEDIGPGDDFSYEDMLLSSAPAPLSGMGRGRRSVESENSFTLHKPGGISSREQPESDYEDTPYSGTLVDRLHRGAAISLPEHMNLPTQAAWTEGESSSRPVPKARAPINITRERPLHNLPDPQLTPPQEQPELENEDMLGSVNRTDTARVRPESTEVDHAWIHKITKMSARNTVDTSKNLNGKPADDMEEYLITSPRTQQAAFVPIPEHHPSPVRRRINDNPIYGNAEILHDSLIGEPVGSGPMIRTNSAKGGTSSTNTSYSKESDKVTSPSKATEAKDFTMRPPPENAKPSNVLGLLPREPRVQTLPMGDLADWVRSTNPNREQESVDVTQPLRVSTPGTKYQANVSKISRHSSARACTNDSSTVSQRMSTKKEAPSRSSLSNMVSRRGSTKPAQTVKTTEKKAVKLKNKPAMQARDAVVRTQPTDDLIDFLREGPLVRDSSLRQSNGTVREGSRVSGSLLDSSATTHRALLASSGAHRTEQPAYSSRPQMLQPPPRALPDGSGQFTATLVSRPRRRVRDPYAIDTDDEDDDAEPTALPSREKRGEESLADFLRNVPPPAGSDAKAIMTPFPASNNGTTFQTSALASREDVSKPTRNTSTRIKIPTAAYACGVNSHNTTNHESPAALRRLTLTPPIARPVTSSATNSPKATPPHQRQTSSPSSHHSHTHTPSPQSATHRLQAQTLTPADTASIAAYQATIAAAPYPNAPEVAGRPGSRMSTGLSGLADTPQFQGTPQFRGSGAGVVQQGKWARTGQGVSGKDVRDPLAAERPLVSGRGAVGGSQRKREVEEGLRLASGGNGEVERVREGPTMGMEKKGGVRTWMRRMGSSNGG